MMEYLMPIGGLIAGALIYLALYESVEEHMDINVNKNIFFAVFIIISLILGVYVTGMIQLGEVAGQNSGGQQKVGVYTCLTEAAGPCNDLINKMNNDAYTAFTASTNTAQYLNLYVGFSLVDNIIKNVFTYFCIGILFVWGSISVYSLRKVEQ
jgi:hypothetical protein